MAKSKKTKTPIALRYHLVLADGTERTVAAIDVEVWEAGTLAFTGANRSLALVIMGGAWRSVELELEPVQTLDA